MDPGAEAEPESLDESNALRPAPVSEREPDAAAAPEEEAPPVPQASLYPPLNPANAALTWRWLQADCQLASDGVPEDWLAAERAAVAAAAAAAARRQREDLAADALVKIPQALASLSAAGRSRRELAMDDLFFAQEAIDEEVMEKAFAAMASAAAAAAEAAVRPAAIAAAEAASSAAVAGGDMVAREMAEAAGSVAGPGSTGEAGPAGQHQQLSQLPPQPQPQPPLPPVPEESASALANELEAAAGGDPSTSGTDSWRSGEEVARPPPPPRPSGRPRPSSAPLPHRSVLAAAQRVAAARHPDVVGVRKTLTITCCQACRIESRKLPAGRAMVLCRCGRASYCSTECATVDWPEHRKGGCAPLPAPPGEAPPLPAWRIDADREAEADAKAFHAALRRQEAAERRARAKLQAANFSAWTLTETWHGNDDWGASLKREKAARAATWKAAGLELGGADGGLPPGPRGPDPRESAGGGGGARIGLRFVGRVRTAQTAVGPHRAPARAFHQAL